MNTRTAVEVTTRYATTVHTLADAWAFIMSRLDQVGESPQVEITPVWVITADSEETPRHFSVVVSGMVEER